MAMNPIITSESYVLTRSGNTGLLQKLCTCKCLSTMSFFVSLITMCSILVLSVLLYVYSVLAEDSKVSALSIAVTHHMVNNTSSAGDYATASMDDSHTTTTEITVPRTIAKDESSVSIVQTEGDFSEPGSESVATPADNTHNSANVGSATAEDYTNLVTFTDAMNESADSTEGSAIAEYQTDIVTFPNIINETADYTEGSVIAEDLTDHVTFTGNHE
ncbi:hypothetical protein MRX96_035986 [Rhipicephalus microplus]